MKIFLAVLFAAILAGAGAFVMLRDSQVEIRLSEAQLLEAISKKLPFRKSYLVILDIVLDNPRITLPEDGDRVHAGVDIVVDIRLGNGRRITGTADASAGVRYRPEDGQFFLVDPNIEKLSVGNVPLAYSEKVDTAIRKTLTAFFNERPVYTLKETDTRQKTAKLILKTVAVQEGVLVLTLGL